jgi:hypothetical protein
MPVSPASLSRPPTRPQTASSFPLASQPRVARPPSITRSRGRRTAALGGSSDKPSRSFRAASSAQKGDSLRSCLVNACGATPGLVTCGPSSCRPLPTGTAVLVLMTASPVDSKRAKAVDGIVGWASAMHRHRWILEHEPIAHPLHDWTWRNRRTCRKCGKTQTRFVQAGGNAADIYGPWTTGATPPGQPLGARG